MTGKSRTMWARVKGEAERAILALPFEGKYALGRVRAVSVLRTKCKGTSMASGGGNQTDEPPVHQGRWSA